MKMIWRWYEDGIKMISIWRRIKLCTITIYLYYIKSNIYFTKRLHSMVPKTAKTNVSGIEIRLNLYWKYDNVANLNLLNLFWVSINMWRRLYEDDIWTWYEDDINMKKDQTLHYPFSFRIMIRTKTCKPSYTRNGILILPHYLKEDIRQITSACKDNAIITELIPIINAWNVVFIDSVYHYMVRNLYRIIHNCSSKFKNLP